MTSSGGSDGASAAVDLVEGGSLGALSTAHRLGRHLGHLGVTELGEAHGAVDIRGGPTDLPNGSNGVSELGVRVGFALLGRRRHRHLGAKLGDDLGVAVLAEAVAELGQALVGLLPECDALADAHAGRDRAQRGDVLLLDPAVDPVAADDAYLHAAVLKAGANAHGAVQVRVRCAVCKASTATLWR
jgi:hypothetical protein